VRGWNAHWERWRLIRNERPGDVAPVQVNDHAISKRMERAARPLPWLCEQVSAWLRVDCWSNAGDHCTTPVLTPVERVHAGTLLRFDRGALRFAFVDTLTSRGIWGISRDAPQVSSHVPHMCYHADGVLDAGVSLGTSSANQARSPVRLIHFWLHGQQYRYLTTVLDPPVLKRSDVVGFSARRWEIERALRAMKDHLHLHHLWSATGEVVQVQRWCCLIVAPVSHALQVEVAGQAGVEVFAVSLDLLVRLTPGWLSRGLTPLEYAVRFGRDLGLLRPSTRHRIEVPWVDPCWVVPPPPEAVHPREVGRSRSQTRGTGTKSVGLVRLNAGTRSLLE
jgi:hypothetical protein